MTARSTLETMAPNGVGPIPEHVSVERVVDFDMYSPPGAAEGVSLHEAWKSLHADGVPDVVWTPRNGGHWIFTRADVIGKGLRDTARLSSRLIFIPRSWAEDYFFIPITKDAPDHRKYRKAFDEALGPKVLSAIKPEVERLANELVDAFASKGRCDFIKDFAEPFPFTILMNLLGLPYEDAAQLKVVADLMMRPDGSLTMPEASQKFYDYVAPIVEDRRRNPSKDALSILVNHQIDGRALTDYEAQNMCALLMIAGLDTVVNFTCYVIHFLATNPEHRKQLVAIIRDNRALEKARDEMFRRFAVVALSRVATEDFTIGDVLIKNDDMVLMPAMMTGLDDRRHSCPMHVDFQREDTWHMSFGTGPHICAGAALARMEADAFLKAWMSKIPEFEVETGTEVRHLSGIVSAVDKLPLVWEVRPSAPLPAA